MDTAEKKAAALLPSSSQQDEVDFHSGYETQYQKEYSPLKRVNVEPPDKRQAWYRNWDTFCMILFLMGIFALGTVLLVVEVFTASPLHVLLIVCVYVIIAAFMIWLEVQSIKVR